MGLLQAQGAKAAERVGGRERAIVHLPREPKESVVGSEAWLAHHVPHQPRRLYKVRINLAGCGRTVRRTVVEGDINRQELIIRLLGSGAAAALLGLR